MCHSSTDWHIVVLLNLDYECKEDKGWQYKLWC